MDDKLMKKIVCYLLVALAYYDLVNGQAISIHGPARVDRNPIYLDSFVPAGMQVIAHVTDLMKYEPTIPAITTLPTLATLPHKPGIFAPVTPPPQPQTTKSPWWKLGEMQYPDIGGYFNRYRYGWSLHTETGTKTPRTRSLNQKDTAEVDWDLLGTLPGDLYKRVNTVEDFDEYSDIFNQVQKFSDDYDDKAPPFLRKKRPPPTRAYVTLLSLYDGLTKECKKLALNKYAGYSRRVLEDLESFSRGTSAEQMEKVFEKIVQRKDITELPILQKLETFIKDLKQPDSYLQQALRDIPPLAYDIHF